MGLNEGITRENCLDCVGAENLAAFCRGERKVLFMFQVCLDDSGTHANSPVTVVAGFIAEASQWSRFEDELSRLREQFEMRGPLHMSEFENRRGEFAHWDQATRIDFMQRLTGIIRRRVRCGIAAALPRESFDRIKSVAASPVAICFGVCCRLVGEWADSAGEQEMVGYVCEDGCDGKGQILDWYAALKSDSQIQQAYRLGPLSFESKNCDCLQVADFFAYETYKRMQNLSGKRFRRSVESIVADLPLRALYLDDEGVDAVLGGRR